MQYFLFAPRGGSTVYNSGHPNPPAYAYLNSLIFCRYEAGVQDTFMTYEVYKDDITMKLVSEACKLLGRPNSSAASVLGNLVPVTKL